MSGRSVAFLSCQKTNSRSPPERPQWPRVVVQPQRYSLLHVPVPRHCREQSLQFFKTQSPEPVQLMLQPLPEQSSTVVPVPVWDTLHLPPAQSMLEVPEPVRSILHLPSAQSMVQPPEPMHEKVQPSPVQVNAQRFEPKHEHVSDGLQDFFLAWTGTTTSVAATTTTSTNQTECLLILPGPSVDGFVLPSSNAGGKARGFAPAGSGRVEGV